MAAPSLSVRRSVFALALVVLWATLLAWAADVPWNGPIEPKQRLRFSGAEFEAVFGSAERQGKNLRVTAPSQNFEALQTLRGIPFKASDFQLLSYRFEGYPRTLDLSLVFRRSDTPDDVLVATLPWPGDGVQTFDLSALPDWHGEIVEIGFAEMAMPLHVPPDLGFKPFLLRSVVLSSPSWSGSLAALATDWFGFWHWSQRSVNALGRESSAPRRNSAPPVFALGAAGGVVLGMLLLGWRGRRAASYVVVFAAVSWLALDSRWLVELVQRHNATSEQFRHAPLAARELLIADRNLLDAAKAIELALVDRPAAAPIAVRAGSPYEIARLLWHLLPRNVVSLDEYMVLNAYRMPPAGTILVMYGSEFWQFDERAGLLKLVNGMEPVRPILVAGALGVFEYRGPTEAAAP